MPEDNSLDTHIKVAYTGMNTELQESQIPSGSYSYCLNGNVFNFDGNALSIGNDSGNVKCVDMPAGFKCIGVKNITTSLEWVLLWLVNPQTGAGQIGYIANDSCFYTVLIDDTNSVDKFGFSIHSPIRKAVVKTTNCSTQIYWTDGLNPRRYIDINDLPWKEIPNPSNAFLPTPVVGQLDSNKLLVQANFSVPTITPTEVQIGGQLRTGTYQFAIQYCDPLGNGYTSFYSVTNPLGIFANVTTSEYNTLTTKAISVQISDLDTTGLYDYFNIAVIKTINNIPVVEHVGTFRISNPTYVYVYTGTEAPKIQLSIADIFEKYLYYDTAQDIFEVDNVLGWANLSQSEDINYQQIWSQVKLQWETYKIPYNKFEGYSNPLNTALYRGYMRDEVYAFEGCFILKNGMQTRSFHIPGRLPLVTDLDIIPSTNPDVPAPSQDPCDPVQSLPRWKVYNTATNLGFTPEYLAHTGGDSCYVGPHQYGEFAYWESTDTYDNNPNIWGSLAGEKIRHHKFPDSLITHIHDDNPNPADTSYVHSIFPIGVKVDVDSLYNALAASGLTQAQLDNIAEFKILRGNRVNNKTVIAKGILNNVGKYDYVPVDDNLVPQPAATETYYFPNYPYNDLRPDPYFTTGLLNPGDGYVPGASVDGFQEPDSERFVFHSPDTHFYQPSVSTGLQLKMETIEWGKSFGKFIQVDQNAKYLFLDSNAYSLAYAAAIASIFNIQIGLEVSTSPGVTSNFSLNPENALPAFQSVLDILQKILPYANMGYFYASYGLYNNHYKIPNSGSKARQINFTEYLFDDYNSIENSHIINNYQREGSVYVNTISSLPYANDYDSSIPADQSRFTIASYGGDSAPSLERRANICSYYGSLKNNLLNPYGQLYSYETIDTGFTHRVYNNGSPYTSFPTVFGGDVFINRFAHKQKLPVFDDNTVTDQDQTDIEYDMIGNFTYPMFWLSTKTRNIISQSTIDSLVDDAELIADLANSVLGMIALTFIGPFVSLSIVSTLIRDVINHLGVSNINLDNAASGQLYEKGLMYLFVYGIPYYFVESEVNCDYRQAINNKEGDFYPNVGNNIPDQWLQEVIVSIAEDNTYNYNQTFSKQNKENVFTHLRPDYDPTDLCFTHYPNRAIWSDASSLEETKNNWLMYKPGNVFDFTKAYGALVSLDKLENTAILARFENKSQIYNAFTRIQPTDGVAAYLGNPQLFSGTPPLDLSETDTGSGGTQHQFLLRTEAGHIYVDAKRGQVLLLRGTQSVDLAEKGMDKWFSQNLPFKILSVSPDVPIDNNFNGIGLHGAYDPLYKRLFITKLDYSPKVRIDYNGVDFFYNNGSEDVRIELGDPEYFINTSWTLSYSFVTQSWISFHSFTPNFYVPHENYFQTGLNDDTCSLWNHNTDFTVFNKYYGATCPYILEYPFSYRSEDEILQNVVDYTKARKYSSFTNWVSPNETIYFNKAVIYNEQECTGVLNLVPRNLKDLSQFRKYPKFNTDSKDIIVNKSDNFYQYNTFWNTVADNLQPIWVESTDYTLSNKDLNQSNMDYTKKSYGKCTMRGKQSFIRHILDNRSDCRLISQFIIGPTMNSKK